MSNYHQNMKLTVTLYSPNSQFGPKYPALHTHCQAEEQIPAKSKQSMIFYENLDYQAARMKTVILSKNL